MTRRRTPGWVRWAGLAVPILVAAVVLVFAGEAPRTGPVPGASPSAAQARAAFDDPCAVLSSAEVGLLVGSRFSDFTPDLAPELARCTYTGFAGSDIPFVEIGVVAGDVVRARRGDTAALRAVLDDLTGAEDAEPVEGIGEEAVRVSGTETLWVLQGDVLVSVVVPGPREGRDAERAVASGLLAKVQALPGESSGRGGDAAPGGEDSG